MLKMEQKLFLGLLDCWTGVEDLLATVPAPDKTTSESLQAVDGHFFYDDNGIILESPLSPDEMEQITTENLESLLDELKDEPLDSLWMDERVPLDSLLDDINLDITNTAPLPASPAWKMDNFDLLEGIPLDTPTRDMPPFFETLPLEENVNVITSEEVSTIEAISVDTAASIDFSEVIVAETAGSVLSPSICEDSDPLSVYVCPAKGLQILVQGWEQFPPVESPLPVSISETAMSPASIASSFEGKVQSPYTTDFTAGEESGSDDAGSCSNSFPSSPAGEFGKPAKGPNIGRKRFISDSEDSDWSPEEKPRKRHRGQRSLGAKQSILEDSHQIRNDPKSRKRDQNKTAATRYREKKRAEVSALLVEEDEALAHNNKLKAKVEQLSTEIGYLKGLMREILKAKGIL